MSFRQNLFTLDFFSFWILKILARTQSLLGQMDHQSNETIITVM